MRVAIVGAGIGGLSAAVGLHQTGSEVTVFERAAEVRAGGSGLSIFANGLRALTSLGLRDAFESVTDRRAEFYTAGQRRPDGRWVAQLPTGAAGQLRIVDRADLHRILLAELAPGTVLTSAEVAEAVPDGTLRFRSAEASVPDSTEHFDLVIGADGLRSEVRTVLDPTVGVRYAGYGAWRGITSVPVDLDGAAGETVGLGRRFGIAPLKDGRVYWFAVANMPEHASFPAAKPTIEQMFAGWHSPISDIIDATDSEAIRLTPICDLDRRLASYHCGRIVLLGDAAHAMTPNLGQGGGQALEDAATLVALLSPAVASRPLEQVLRRYDDLRLKRSQSIAERSRHVGDMFQLESRTLAGLRNAVFGALPAQAIAAQVAAVQKWSPPPLP